MYHSALQHPLVLLTTNLFDYYFLTVPGFEPGYICQRAGNVSTTPLPLTSGWIIFFILLLSTYFRYRKGTPIIRDRFESCYLHHWQLRRNSHAHTHKHSPNHVWWQSQSQAQAQARYLTIYMPLTLPWIFTVITWLKWNSCGLYHFLHLLHFLHFWEIVFFSNFDKIPLQSSARHRQLTPSQGALRPLRLCYFGHWESVADDWHRATCGVYLKWKVHGECIYLKCNLHGQFTHTTAALLQIYPTNLHLTICAIAAADMKWSLQYFKLCTLEWQL